MQVSLESPIDVENVTVWISKPQSRVNEMFANEYKIMVGDKSSSMNERTIDSEPNSICGAFHDGMLVNTLQKT